MGSTIMPSGGVLEPETTRPESGGLPLLVVGEEFHPIFANYEIVNCSVIIL